MNGKTLVHPISQKDAGVKISSDFKWKTQIYEQVTKANRTLGMTKRSTIHVTNVSTRRSLHLTLVRSHLAFVCELWRPQTIITCMELNAQSNKIHTLFTFLNGNKICFSEDAAPMLWARIHTLRPKVLVLYEICAPHVGNDQ